MLRNPSTMGHLWKNWTETNGLCFAALLRLEKRFLFLYKCMQLLINMSSAESNIYVNEETKHALVNKHCTVSDPKYLNYRFTVFS